MTNDAASPTDSGAPAESKRRLGKDFDEAMDAWFNEGHTDKMVALMRRLLCGIGTLASDAPSREAFAVLGRLITAAEDWSRLDQQHQIQMLAKEAKDMTGADKLSEGFARQILAWSVQHREQSGAGFLEGIEKGFGMFMPMLAGGQLGEALRAIRPKVQTGAVQRKVQISEVGFSAKVDGKEIEYAYTDDADLDLLFACPTPTGDILHVWGRDPAPGPLAAGAAGPEPAFSAIGFYFVTERGRRHLLDFHRVDSITLLLAERRPLGEVLTDFISRLTFVSPIGEPDFFEVLEPSEETGAAGEGQVAL